MANFLGKTNRIEFNGHDVSHLTGMSIGSMGKTFDTFQTLSDAFDHDIEIAEEASGSFDIIASDLTSGEQRFKEMMQYVFGYIDLDTDSVVTTDSVSMTAQDWTDPDTQGSYTGSRFMTIYRRLAEGDASLSFDGNNDSVWIKFRAMGETIDSMSLCVSSTGGSGGNAASMKAKLYDDMGNTTAFDGTAASGGTTTTLVDSGVLTQGDNYWIGATLKITSGANIGLTRTITDSTSAQVTFDALPYTVSSSDTYTISGVPSNTAVSGPSELAFSLDYNTYNSAVKWVNFSSGNISDWTGLTIGKDYWMRVYRVSTTGNTPIIRTDSTRANLTGGLYTRDEQINPESGTVGAGYGIRDGLEAIHYLKFKSTEGLKVVAYDYTNNQETSGVKWTFNKVKLDSVTPSFASKQATRASVSWKSFDWSYDAI